jgi:hypothetical protein
VCHGCAVLKDGLSRTRSEGNLEDTLTTWLNRCPQCRSSLTDSVGPNCPNCGHLLRTPRAGRRAEPVPAAPAPVDPPAPPLPETSTSALPWESGGVPAGPGGLTLSSTPLPPPRGARRRVPLVVKILAVVGALFIAHGAFLVVRDVVGRDEALASPARDLVREPCAQYREIGYRLGLDKADAQAVVAWVHTNTATFDKAVLLDPKLEGAAGTVHWLSDLFAVPAQAARTRMDEIHGREEPLQEACTTGPGRA